jgi:sodium/hydrogen exchanger 8
MIESFVYGSLLSAIDPVITLAIFRALKVNPKLYIITFGESLLNDAIAIVMFSTALDINSIEIRHLSAFGILRYGIYRFLSMFFVSALLGIGIGMISSLLYKHIYFRKTPALEMALLLIFAYLPYGLGEAMSLSGNYKSDNVYNLNFRHNGDSFLFRYDEPVYASKSYADNSVNITTFL